MTLQHSMARLNGLSHDEFVRVCGSVFEKSPWIAAAIAGARPFATREAMLEAMRQRVRTGTPEEQLALIQAHPDLVGRAALTAESQREQASAGLMELAPEEIELFRRQNSAYWERFGFPFVICARLNKKTAILKGFAQRLKNPREVEMETALNEIFKIADLRMRELCPEN